MPLKVAPRIQILGSRIDPVTADEALARIEGFIASGTPHHVITGNTLMLLEAQEDEELRNILSRAALVTPESSGILWASRTLGKPLEEFTPGIDLMVSICRMIAGRGHPAFFLGAQPGVAQSASEELRQRFSGLRIAGVAHGYFKPDEESRLITTIRQAKPAVLFVAMGMPAQEKWIARHLDALQVPVVMGVGGSFDVFSGRLARAPQMARRFGVEWLYRLVQEPWRWRRIAKLPVFAWKVIRSRWQTP